MPQLNVLARGYLYLLVLVFSAVGLTALFAPQVIAAKFDLLPQSVKGIAEIRGLYGGGVLAWGLVTWGALRRTSLSPGLLVSMTVIMGAIAAVRVMSIMVDHETALNVPAGIAEVLLALACWKVYKHGNTA
jgi:hypothetical protein